jgi:hypothetical protein
MSEPANRQMFNSLADARPPRNNEDIGWPQSKKVSEAVPKAETEGQKKANVEQD